MSFFAKLFGGGTDTPKTSNTPAEEHAGFKIYVEPMKEAAGYRISARIEKDVDGETQSHHMIRADVCQNLDEAHSTSLLKAKMLIDQQGDAIFR